MPNTPRLLIVDDDRDVRLIVSHALEPSGYDVATAANGQDALEQLEAGSSCELVLLDLNMPGMDGIEVLQQIAGRYPETRVIVISAHGTIDNAVEVMKLGAIDFVQKPFTAQEIRNIVDEVLERGDAEAAAEQTLNYQAHLDMARHYAGERRLKTAVEHARTAIGIDPTRPEAFNVLGVLEELRGNRIEANKQYRVALDLDPTYEPARTNLSARGSLQPLDLG